MANEIPTFIGQGAVAPAQVVSAAPIHEMYANMYGELQKKSASLENSLADQEMSKRGTIAGEGADFHTLPAFSEAAQKYNEAGLLSNKYTMTTDALSHLNQFHEKASENVSQDSINVFNAQAKGYAAGAFEAAPAENKAYLKNLLTYKTTQLQSSLQHSLFQKEQLQASAQFAENYDSLNNEMQNAASHGDMNAASSFHGQMISGLDAAAKLGVVSPMKAVLLQQNAKKQLYTNQAEGDFNVIMSNGVLKDDGARIDMAKHYIDSFGEDKTIQKTLSPIEINTVKKQLGLQLQQVLQKVGLGKSQIKSQQKAMVDGAFQTGNINANTLASLQGVMAPEEFSKFQTILQANQHAGQEIKQITQSSIPVQNKLLENMQAERGDIDWTNPDQLDEQTLYTKKMQMANDIAVKKLADPVTYTAQLSAYQDALERHREDPIMFPDSSMPSTMLSLEKQQGYPANNLSLLSKPQAATMAATINALQPKDQVAYIQAMKNKYNTPEEMSIAMRDLHRSGLKQDLQVMYSVGTNPETADQINNLTAAYTAPLGDLKKAVNTADGSTKTFANIESQVSSALAPTLKILTSQQGLTPKIYNHIQNAAVRLAAYDHAMNGTASDVAAQTAADTVLNKQYTSSSLNGSDYLIPRTDLNGNTLDTTRTPAMLRLAFNNAINNGISPRQGFLLNEPQSVRVNQYTNDVIATGHWINNSNIGYRLVDMGGVSVKDKDGNNITISYNDLGDTESEPNKNLDAQLALNAKKFGKITKGLGYPARDLDPMPMHMIMMSHPKNLDVFANPELTNTNTQLLLSLMPGGALIKEGIAKINAQGEK